MNILLLTHDFGFPEGYAPTLRARLISRALVQAGASVQVYCLRYSEMPPDILNTRTSGVYEGVPFRYPGGRTTPASSFAGRRATDARSMTSAMSSIIGLRRAGRLDAVYLWSTAMHWNALSQTYLSFFNTLKIPVILELNERPWNQGSHPNSIEKRLSPLRGVAGAVVISDYLEKWAASEAKRLGRRIPVIRVPIVVDTDETRQGPPLAPRANPFVMFACPPGRTALFQFVTEAMRSVWKAGITCDLVITGSGAIPGAGASSGSGGDRGAGSGDDFDGDPSAGGDPGGSGRADPGGDPAGAHAPGPGSIDWLGTISRDTLLGLYRQARALLLPLSDELNSQARFPTKLGEYLASGTPVVASARGELLSYLSDGVSAFLAGSAAGSAAGAGAGIADAEAFGRRIVDVLSDPAAAGEVGRRGRAVAVEEFDYRRYGGVLYEWFHALIGNRTWSRAAVIKGKQSP